MPSVACRWHASLGGLPMISLVLEEGLAGGQGLLSNNIMQTKLFNCTYNHYIAAHCIEVEGIRRKGCPVSGFTVRHCQLHKTSVLKDIQIQRPLLAQLHFTVVCRKS